MPGKMTNSILDHHSDHPRYWQPSAARVYLAGRSEKRKYSPQLGSYLGIPVQATTGRDPVSFSTDARKMERAEYGFMAEAEDHSWWYKALHDGLMDCLEQSPRD